MKEQIQNYDKWIEECVKTHGSSTKFQFNATRVLASNNDKIVGIYYEEKGYGEVVDGR
jgi:hypothetical protein